MDPAIIVMLIRLAAELLPLPIKTLEWLMPLVVEFFQGLTVQGANPTAAGLGHGRRPMTYQYGRELLDHKGAYFCIGCGKFCVLCDCPTPIWCVRKSSPRI
jgi:hypothetical protein